jgi:Carbohydrate binding domain
MLKPRNGLLAILMVLMASALCITAQAAGEKNEQLLKNPDFEMGTHKQPGLGAIVPKHWHRDWKHTGKVEVLQDEKIAHRGKGCVRVATASISQGKHRVEPGMRYRVRVWMKAEGDARQSTIIYQYAIPKGKKKPSKGMPSWGFGSGGNVKAAQKWTLYERVYTAPADGSVDAIAVAIHVGSKKGTKGAALIDDITMRAWDGRTLAVRVASCPIFADREKYEQAMAKHAEIKKARGPALTAIYAKAEKLQTAAKKADAALEAREALEIEFEALLKEYAKIREEVELDLEDL